MKKILFRQGAGYLINGRIDVSLYPTEEQDRENLEIDSRDFRHLELRSTDKLLLHTKNRIETTTKTNGGDKQESCRASTPWRPTNKTSICEITRLTFCQQQKLCFHNSI